MNDQHNHEFDAERAARARDEAIERVGRNADVEWKGAAADYVWQLARHRGEFTTDAVWAMLDRNGHYVTGEPRAMGAIMRCCSASGICEATDRTAQSIRVECHRRPVRVWRSLIHGEP